jgi:FKBP-type peptidyl-prolyl cis-trans isomerase FkpA
MLKSRYLLVFFVFVCFYMACKTDPLYDDIRAQQAAIDDAIIAKFIDSLDIPAQRTPDGLYYQIIEPGTPLTRAWEKTDTIGIHYVGRFLTGQVFDSTAVADKPTKFLMADVIQGWSEGIVLIHPGGRIRLIVPSALAYQNRQIGVTDSIPPNSILDFDIKLISVAPPVPPETDNNTTKIENK